MIDSERDLDLVLITGAGASAPFGVNDKPLPLMAEWSNHLVQELAVQPGYLELTGLGRDLDGPAFEHALGAFLDSVEAFRKVKGLLAAPSMLAGTTMQANLLSELPGWYANVEAHLGQIVNVIRGSLYELFGDPRVDLGKAQVGYGDLFGALGIDHESRLVYATTNYDRIGERVLEAQRHQGRCRCRSR